MSYMALYRKWRPDSFEEVKGQEHIVTTLKNQVKHERIGHAYLFCGTRGTGKTTIAKLLAKAVNCEHPVDGSPCNECASCKAIASGASMNVIEIDAASNNGVDNIRQINNAVQYSPTNAKYLVYIIDEVHMLSIGAFNALLKTLEEPPEYVIFILATTEAHKIPITINSRCQRYDFKRISNETITDRLLDLLEREDIKASRDAISYVAKAADGSMRDALSILDQCIAFNLGEELTYDRVLLTIGAVDTDVYLSLYESILERNVSKAVAIIEEAIYQGKDLNQFVIEFITFLRNALMLKFDPSMKVDMTSEKVLKLKSLGDKVSAEYLISQINILQEAANKISYSTAKRVHLEVAIIKLCTPAMQEGTAALELRIEELEKQLEGRIKQILEQTPVAVNVVQASGADMPDGANTEAYASAGTGAATDKALLSAQVTKNIEDKYPPARVHELKLIAATHKLISQRLPMPAKEFFDRAILRETSTDGQMDLVVEEKKENISTINYFKRDDFREGLETAIEGIVGRRIKINFKAVDPKLMDSRMEQWDLTMLNLDGIEIEHNK